jgi:hypothetical protein
MSEGKTFEGRGRSEAAHMYSICNIEFRGHLMVILQKIPRQMLANGLQRMANVACSSHNLSFGRMTIGLLVQARENIV